MNARADLGATTERLLDRPAERLVVVGFRSWMAGYEHGSIECWEVAWNAFAGDLGAVRARRAFGDLQYWIRTIRDATRRTIECFPHCCRCVCRDECMALSVVSALQMGDRTLARAAAVHLTEASHAHEIDLMLEAGAAFASALVEAERRLLPVTRAVVDTIANHTAEPRPGDRLIH